MRQADRHAVLNTIRILIFVDQDIGVLALVVFENPRMIPEEFGRQD